MRIEFNEDKFTSQAEWRRINSQIEQMEVEKIKNLLKNLDGIQLKMNTMEEKQKKFKNKNLFDYLRNILTDKDIELYEKHIKEEGFETDFKKFMELKYLSMSTNPKVRNIIIKYQFSFDKMPCEIMYKTLIKVIPRQDNYFIKYIK